MIEQYIRTFANSIPRALIKCTHPNGKSTITSSKYNVKFEQLCSNNVFGISELNRCNNQLILSVIYYSFSLLSTITFELLTTLTGLSTGYEYAVLSAVRSCSTRGLRWSAISPVPLYSSGGMSLEPTITGASIKLAGSATIRVC